jgi:hypothetical protein
MADYMSARGACVHSAALRGAKSSQREDFHLAALPRLIFLRAMRFGPRKGLPHEIPLWVDPRKEIYFITVNCRPRFRNQLALPETS